MGHVDTAARLLVFLIGLNVNGVLNLWLGLGQPVSFLIFASAIYLALSINPEKALKSLAFKAFFVSIISYLLLGSVFYSNFDSVSEPARYWRAYGSTLLIVYALSAYIARLPTIQDYENIIAFTRNIFFIAGASVWLSPWLYTLYVNLPPSAEQRMGGFFGNPNEAAMVSLLGIALVILQPYKRSVINFLVVAVLIVSVLLTFSKTGMLLLLVIAFVWGVSALKGFRLVMALAVLPLGILALNDLPNTLSLLVDSPMLDLDPSQKRRIMVLPTVLAGEINQETTTGRTFLWGLALKSVIETFPLGLGLGSMHHIIGGLEEFGVWQGAHNTFLMVAGESGVLPLLLIIFSFGSLFLGILAVNAVRLGLFFAFLILLVDMFVTHGAMATRYHNLGVALLFGIPVCWAEFTKRKGE